MAFGVNSSAGFNNSVAFGTGAITSMANQMMFGTSVTIYTLPGLGGAGGVGTANQSGNLYYVTTDEDGNLGTEATGGSAKTSNPGTAKTAGVSSSPVSNSQPPIDDEALDTSLTDLNDQVLADGPQVTGVSDQNIGTNIRTAPANPARPVSRNSVAMQSVSSFNANAISVNSDSIDVNSKAIQSNKVLIDQAFTKIDSNTAAIEKSLESLKDVESGLAAVAALPDMYLSPDAKWSAAGGAAVFGDEVGFGATLAIRGNTNWSFGGSAAMGGDQATGKVQVRYEGF
jgi:hypothetical protein